MSKLIIDGEEVCSGGVEVIPVTQAEYNALSETARKNGTYLITDADGLTAKDVAYDDTETGLGVDNVQDAIVEQNKKIENVKSEWKLVQTITGVDKSIDITSVIDKADEFLACVSASNVDVVLTINIPKSELKSSVRTFRTGYYQDSSKLGSTRVEATNTRMLIGNLNIDGTAYESTLTFTLYYR